MDSFIPDIRIDADPPSSPRRGGCLVSAITLTGLAVVGTLLLVPAVQSARNAARASQTI